MVKNFFFILISLILKLNNLLNLSFIFYLFHDLFFLLHWDIFLNIQFQYFYQFKTNFLKYFFLIETNLIILLCYLE